jgi:hypothetical protein
MDSAYRFSPAYEISFDDLTDNYYAWIRASVKVLPSESTRNEDVLLVVTFNYQGKYYKYRTAKLQPGDPATWQNLEIDYLTPEPRTGKDELNVYIWYRGSDAVYVDDLKVELFDPVNE